MKKLLTLILTSVIVFFLVACGAKNDNGTYTYSREKDGTTYTVIIKIENNTGTLTFEEKGEDGQTQSEEQGLTVDQERKTLTAENDNSTVDYEIVDGVLTLDTLDSTLANAEFTKE
ncbi:TPA: hypothetical protein ACGPAW_000711 [Streptococcus suis]|uniref:hypothetical protein n=1 Tax=Streptococcus suis TaxID=1307 RepID=UPI0003F7770C|nr:hypothetical protein [Streptococcus suis]NQK50202.1 hypothetical protein [Streptococcus suis]RRR48930.1 hypothetical protein EI999_11020 [Streptococcus suis]HEL1693134.1 hypothetical protein [Streptococcus suis]HEL1708531.1 hypothetical protein [Streptococcus suis]HEL1777638.1 hypothetical protein [Streptococcus suis]